MSNETSNIMTETPPLISYVLFCYNQAEFIEEAIRSAINQDYPNLEIIVNDDCSPDDTFELAKCFVDRFGQEKNISVQRNSTNLGLIGNFNAACARASGDLIVIAAGDDASLEHRVSTLADVWQRTSADIVYSSYKMIDQHGLPVESNDEKSARYNVGPLFKKQSYYGFAGAAAAYSKRLISKANLTSAAGAEDIALLFYALAHGMRIEGVPDKLVLYRQHSASTSNLPDQSLKQSEDAYAKATAMGVKALNYLADIFRSSSDPRVRDAIDYGLLQKEIAYHVFVENWLNSRFMERVQMFLTTQNRAHRRWLAPRLFGIEGLALAKSAAKKIRRPLARKI